MYRHVLHLSELLQQSEFATTPPERPTTTTYSTEWTPKKRLKPGRFQRIRVNKTSARITKLQSEVTSDTKQRRFVYDRALTADDNPHVIRLLRVLPGHRNDSIICALQYASPTNMPYYEAISYCWEGQVPSTIIECDGQPMCVTKNLRAAITDFRRKDEDILLWADAICIDQNSIEEKNSQVPLMSLVYQNAGVVRIWLGDDIPEKTCQEAFHVLRALTSAYRQLGWDFDYVRKGSDGKSHAGLQIPALDDASWDSVTELLRKPWFGRVWIIQEVTTSQNAVLHCGSASMAWEDFHLGTLFALNAGFLLSQYNILSMTSSYQPLIGLLVTYSCFTQLSRYEVDLLSLLETHRSTGATDPRDKIYALIGLCSSNKLYHKLRLHGIKPDYSLNVIDGYVEVAKEILTNSQTLDLLSVPQPMSHSAIRGLPSWVPDWSANPIATSLTLRRIDGRRVYSFAAATEEYSSAHVTFNNHSLFLQGYSYDTIAKMGKVMNPLTRPDTVEQQVSPILGLVHTVEVLYNWRRICFGSVPSPSCLAREPANIRYARTLRFNDFTRGDDLPTVIKNHNRTMYRVGSTVWARLLECSTVVNLIRWYDSHFAPRAVYRYYAKEGRANEASDLFARTSGRRMIVTEMGYVGLAPAETEIGDSIVLAKGARVPLVLRPTATRKWTLLGDCYIHGITDGEAFEAEKCNELEVV